MDTKIKNNLPTESIPFFKYKQSISAWGLSGEYKGYNLEFYQNLLVKKAGLFKVINSSGKTKKDVIDIYSLLSPYAKKAWIDAYKICKKRGGKELAVEDIFLALLKTNSVKMMLQRIKVNPFEAEKLIKNYLKLTPAFSGQTVQKIPFEAFALSVKLHNHKVGTLMLLGGLLKATPHENILQAIFTNIGLTVAKLELFAVWFLNLNHDFPKDSTSEKLIYTMNQAQNLEAHFGYYFEFPAIEKAMQLSRGQTLKDLEHKKALQLLVKAGKFAKEKKKKIISAEYIETGAHFSL
jgi:ATP-dependent Clp protease ATP-binding subunit ClpA